MNSERVETLKKLLAMDPEDTFTQYALGLEYVEADPEEALRHFQAVVARDADYVPGYFQAGRVLAAHDRRDEARKWLERGLATAERVADWHAHGEIQEALDELE